jgi:hypothetical protein
MVPVIAIGFDDLRERVGSQNQQATEHTKKLADLKSRSADHRTFHIQLHPPPPRIGDTNADRASAVDVRAAFAFVDSCR